MSDRERAIETARSRRHELYDAMVDVESAAGAATATPAWRSAMWHALDRLSNAFDAHVTAAEDRRGIIESVIEDEPRMGATAEYLMREHATIRAKIASVTYALKATESPMGAEEAESIRELVLELFVDLSRHRQRGSDFVWEAYDVDIGGGS